MTAFVLGLDLGFAISLAALVAAHSIGRRTARKQGC